MRAAIVIIATILLSESAAAHGVDKPRQRYEFAELNHVEDGTAKFTQLIFWEWNGEYRRLDVARWMIVDDAMYATLVPIGRDHYRVVIPRNPSRSYEFRAKIFHESWTDYDPERVNRLLNAK